MLCTQQVSLVLSPVVILFALKACSGSYRLLFYRGPIHKLPLLTVPEFLLAVHQLPHSYLPRLNVQDLAVGQPFFSFTVTASEVSIITAADVTFPEAITSETGWVALKMQEPEGGINFGVIGLLAEGSGILRDSNISIFAVSTYLTDWILLKQERLSDAEASLQAKGWEVRRVTTWK